MSTITGLSVEEFRAGEWPRGAQLVEGEVVVNDPTFRHQEMVLRIVRALAEWTEAGPGRGTASIGGNWVLAESNLYIPDVWWAAEGRGPDPAAASSAVPPGLVVEVRSAGTWRYDIGPKRAVYERAGVAELWLVDTPARTVLAYRRSRTDVAEFDLDLEIGPGEVLATPLLDGFNLTIDVLFR